MTATMTRPQTRTGNRTEALHEMLARYDEAKAESSGVGGGGTHNESRINAFDPTTYTPAYRELDRCLERLKWLAYHGRPMIAKNVNAYRGWWNLDQRYFRCEKVQKPIHLRKTRSGDRIPAGLPRNMAIASRATILNGSQALAMVWVWDPRVDLAVVDETVAWISKEFRGTPSVYSEAA